MAQVSSALVNEQESHATKFGKGFNSTNLSAVELVSFQPKGTNQMTFL